jgi:uncharacterized protein
MSDHPNAAIVRRTLESFNTGDMQAMSDGLDDNVVWHEIGNPDPVMGKAALAARLVGDAKPDYEITGQLHDVVGNDDHTIALVTAHATRGSKVLDYRVAEIYHMRDGKIIERWAFSDDTAAIAAFFGG